MHALKLFFLLLFFFLFLVPRAYGYPPQIVRAVSSNAVLLLILSLNCFSARSSLFGRPWCNAARDAAETLCFSLSLSLSLSLALFDGDSSNERMMATAMTKGR
jgi:hypothetical protein